MTNNELRIDPEFQKKIPPLTDEEFDQLRENILSDGEVYEPIVIWEVTIIDGHNRWKILQEHPEIPYHIRKMEFIDKWAAFDWMYKKQLGRRNLSDEQRTLLIGNMYENRKKHRGNNAHRDDKGRYLRGQIDPSGEATKKTRQKLAEELGVGEKTVVRAGKFAKGIDAIRSISDEAADKILRGGSGVKKQTVMDFPKMEPDVQTKLTEAIVSGKTTSDSKETDCTDELPETLWDARKSKRANTEKTLKNEDTDEPEPSMVWDPVRRKRIDPMIDQINAEGRDPTRIREYTLDDMIAEMRTISENHTSQLHRVLVIRSTLLNNAEARDAVFAFITESVAALEELRLLVQPGVA